MNKALNNGIWITNFEVEGNYIVIEEKFNDSYRYGVANIAEYKLNNTAMYIFEDHDKNDIAIFETPGQLNIYLSSKTKSKTPLIKINLNIVNDQVEIIKYDSFSVDDENVLFINDGLAIAYYKYGKSLSILDFFNEKKQVIFLENDILDILSNEYSLIIKSYNRGSIYFEQILLKDYSIKQLRLPNIEIKINSKWVVNNDYLLIFLNDTLWKINLSQIDFESSYISSKHLNNIFSVNKNTNNSNQFLIQKCNWPNTDIQIYDLEKNGFQDKEFCGNYYIHKAKGYEQGYVLLTSKVNEFPALKIVNIESSNNVLESNENSQYSIKIFYEKYDGKEIPYIYMKNNKKKNDNLIFMFHGGPSGAHYNTWNPFVNLLLKYNYDVVMLNNIGSVIPSCGLPYIKKGEYGTKDIRSITNLIEKCSLGYKNIFAYGNSYGGYLSVLLAKINRNIKRVVITSSFLDSRTLVNSKDVTIRNFAKIAMKKNIVADTQTISFPLLILNGEKDYKLPTADIKRASIDNPLIEYIEFKGESHVFRKLKNIEEWMTKSILFLERGL